MATTSTPVKKKRPVKKVAGSSSTSTSSSSSDVSSVDTGTTTSVTKKRPSKKVVSTGSSSTTKKTPVKNDVSSSTTSTRTTDEHGFGIGTDISYIAQALREGGVDRNDVNAKAEALIAENNGLTNRSGKPKYIPSVVSSVLGRLIETGKFRIESSWTLVPVDGDPITPAPRGRTAIQNPRDKSAVTKKTATKARPTKKVTASTATPKKVVRKRPSAAK